MGFPCALSVSGSGSYGPDSEIAAKMGRSTTLEDQAVGLIHFEGTKILYLEAGYFDNEEEEESKGLLLHSTKGGAHNTKAFGRTRVDR